MKTNRVDLNRKRPLTPRFQLIYLKVKNIIKSQFGLDLTYHPFPESGFKNEEVFKSLLKNNSPLYLLEKIVFPVCLNNLMIGVADITGGQKLPKKQVTLIKSLVELLSINESNSSQLESLSFAEEQMARNHQPIDSNLIFFKQHNTQKKELQSTFTKKNTPAQKELTNFSCIIKSNSYNDIRMMAQELHYFSNRYALINSDDLELHTLDLESFNEMGPITLLIPELSHLTPKEVALIYKVILQHSGDKNNSLPKVFLGSIYSMDTLIKSNALTPDLLKKLALFNMEKSFFELKKEGLTEFFYTELQKKPYLQ